MWPLQRNVYFPRGQDPWNLQGDFSVEPRYNIAPSVPVIIKGEHCFEAKLMKWGLVPSRFDSAYPAYSRTQWRALGKRYCCSRHPTIKTEIKVER